MEIVFAKLVYAVLTTDGVRLNDVCKQDDGDESPLLLMVALRVAFFVFILSWGILVSIWVTGVARVAFSVLI